MSGNEATEENFKLLQDLNSSPDIIYFSTHGFFIENAKTDKQYKGFWTANNPLFRSGLALTSANKMYKEKSNYLGYQDGILTAFDISNMDLSGTKLVILSACDTAKGDIDNSEGVYGLQRAFKMAGVEHVLMTLWKIPDNEQTILFMHTFYSNWLGGMSVEAAFQKTQQELKSKLAPEVWGAFVLI